MSLRIIRYKKPDYQKLRYHSAPKKKKTVGSLDEIDPDMRAAWDKLGIPIGEQVIKSPHYKSSPFVADGNDGANQADDNAVAQAKGDSLGKLGRLLIGCAMCLLLTRPYRSFFLWKWLGSVEAPKAMDYVWDA